MHAGRSSHLSSRTRDRSCRPCGVQPGGGGGCSDPFRRYPAKVLADVRERYVLPDAARRDNGAAINLERWTVDEVETARLRTLPPPPDAPPVGDAPGPRPLVDVHA